MTWMPDRDAAPRRRRRRSSSQEPAQLTAQQAAQQTTQQTETAQQPPVHPDRTYDVERQQRAGTHRMGLPRILGRRARWVGARLRREP
ncbi:hypothetical protein [Kitasatospora sp. MAP5-34]|uniref:hypothetical protein n=1 Tax=Kitasatospora sp. MAP5-34 TaxID=3035102 RepID=UPI002475B94D|nr:hypothetical protein [Kitasatospora sp. MAP5-34]MDH6578996.1 hypothetical protein [Kitasatospora sp. MAP5-34]